MGGVPGRSAEGEGVGGEAALEAQVEAVLSGAGERDEFGAALPAYDDGSGGPAVDAHEHVARAVALVGAGEQRESHEQRHDVLTTLRAQRYSYLNVIVFDDDFGEVPPARFLASIFSVAFLTLPFAELGSFSLNVTLPPLLAV